MEFQQTCNPCIGCEYYNKPYWSIISPCKNCYRNRTTSGTSGYLTTDTSGSFEQTTTTSNFDTVDYAIVKHGEWEPISGSNFVCCSICHTATMSGFNYCPNCGAKMKKIKYIPSKKVEE